MSSGPVAPTARTPSYAPGYSTGLPSAFSLPAEATTSTPLLCAYRTASSSAASRPQLPRLMLSTRAPASTAWRMPLTSEVIRIAPSASATFTGSTRVRQPSEASPIAVVGGGGDDAGRRGAVPDGVGVAGAERRAGGGVVAGQQLAGEVGVGRVDAAVQDGDHDVAAAGGVVPAPRRAFTASRLHWPRGAGVAGEGVQAADDVGADAGGDVGAGERAAGGGGVAVEGDQAARGPGGRP